MLARNGEFIGGFGQHAGMRVRLQKAFSLSRSGNENTGQFKQDTS